MGQILMEKYDYYGWQVLDEPMYRRFADANIDVTTEDIKEMSKIINNHIPKRRTAIDIGCHYGFFTKYLSSVFDNVHAFDFPNDVLKCCRHNLRQCENVTIHDNGIGDTNGQVHTTDWSKKHKRRAPLGMHVDPKNSGRIYPIKTLDSFAIPHVDLIMIDTEGYEKHVLKGAESTIKKHKPVLVIEFHRTFNNKIDNLTKKFGYTLADLQTYVESLGYRSLAYISKVDQVFVPKA